MKAHLTRGINPLRILMIILMVLLFSACEKEVNFDSVICHTGQCALYSKVAEQILPTSVVEQSDSQPYYHLDKGAIAEAFDTQAVGALETGLAQNWYPHYLATVIIAIDRDQTEAQITSWSDLYSLQEEVSFLNTPGHGQMFIAAMSYGLEGEHYTLTRAIQLMESLHDRSLLQMNSTESPILICYDCQAAGLIEEGRNIEILIPEEGTFTYQKGLLANKILEFQGDVDQILLESKHRLLDGKSDPKVYPNETAYKSAVRVSDYKHFAKVTQNANRLMERNVLNTRRYMSIDNFEHLLWALIYIMIITIWAASIMRRSMQKGISRAAFYTSIILTGWIFVRLIKYQLESNPVLARYLWYGFYFFQLTLPLVLLWMAWAVDKPENKIFPPRWWVYMASLVSGLIVLVFTNDLHGLVLRLDLNRPDWDIHYGYGLGYYIILFVCMANLVAVFIILLKKSLRNPRKKRMVLPLVIFFLFGLYNYKYIVRDPFIYATDLTIITGLFTMLMFESCMRSGMIPVNTKYIELFRRSPLKMQIINREKEVVLESTSVIPLSQEMLASTIESSPVPILQANDTLLFANPIPGGYTIWHEDVSKLYQLHRDIEESTQMLIEANAMLMEEKKLKRSINQSHAKKQLMEQLEGEIATQIGKLTQMIQKVSDGEGYPKQTTPIALLLCYIKRRCNLFFEEKETHTTKVEKVIALIEELAEIAKHANLEIANVMQIKGSLDIRQGTLFYDFFYAVVDLVIQTDCSYMIGYLEEDDQELSMGLLPSENIGLLELDPALIEGITGAKGKVTTKELEGTIAIKLSFPREEAPYD